ncbi:hypothetical protein SEPCBS119000_005236 [Sporothrix epigloea]|uniref:Ankyrin repeat protein n=1 Tax=Sporothrix epigloea TaxID=1892477 RepID=A0ABP0DWS8_9PEZI
MAMTRLLLEKKAEVEPKHENEVPALYRAAEAGHHAVVKELLLNHANQNEVVPSRLGQTALFAACLGGHDQIVRLLIDHDADVEIRDEQGRTVLLYMASKRDRGNWTMDTMRLLLGHGYADTEARDTDGLTPLLWAVTHGNLQLAEALLDESLGRAVADVTAVNDSGETALHMAAKASHEAMVRLLLRYRADPNALCKYGWTPLHFPSYNDQEAMVSLLLDANANVHAEMPGGRTALHLAASQGSEAVVRLLLRYKADPNVTSRGARTPLHDAARRGHEAAVLLLLDAGANVNTKRFDGVTALHLAARNGSEAVVKMLLGSEADAKVIDDGGTTPLHDAAQNGREAVVSLLLNAGADVNAKLYNGMTALHMAAFNGFEAVVKQLLARDEVEPNIRDSNGRTPTLCATEQGHFDIVQLLSPMHAERRLSPAARAARNELKASAVDPNNFRDGTEHQRRVN